MASYDAFMAVADKVHLGDDETLVKDISAADPGGRCWSTDARADMPRAAAQLPEGETTGRRQSDAVPAAMPEFAKLINQVRIPTGACAAR